MFSGQAKGL